MVIRRGARAESLFFSFFFRVCNRAAGLAWLEGLEDFRRPETQKKKSLHQQPQGRSGDAWRRQPPHHTDSNSSPQYYLILSYPSPSVRLYLPIADERVCLIDGPCPREPHPLPPPRPLPPRRKLPELQNSRGRDRLLLTSSLNHRIDQYVHTHSRLFVFSTPTPFFASSSSTSRLLISLRRKRGGQRRRRPSRDRRVLPALRHQASQPRARGGADGGTPAADTVGDRAETPLPPRPPRPPRCLDGLPRGKARKNDRAGSCR